MASTVKKHVKRIIDYPNPKVHTITTDEYLRAHKGDPVQGVIQYLKSLFPILGWIGRYNLGWLTGDLIAGITVGIVLVPQSMSYATIATLSPQYGLYSAFVGVFIYCFFATSKDVSIGPVAVMSLTVSKIIKHVQAAHPDEWESATIATAVSFICGFIVLGIGLLRLGWIVEFIPLPAVSGFMTGSAINIAVGQVPGLMGITGFDTRAATYKVIINTLKGLPRTNLNAAFGLPALAALYIARFLCDWLSRRYPRRARFFFFLSITRNGFIIIVLTIASWLSMRHRKSSSGSYPINILKTVPSGFRDVGPPTINTKLLSALASELPVATIILLLEHIAISKSFGRVNGYKINPNQELIAIGVTNTVGSVFNAYPATGSFSRSALKAKSGVRTPLAGIFTGIVVIVALYGLTPAFYWIPNAGLAAIIIHAVSDLVAKPSHVYQLWRVSPVESIIFFATVVIIVFTTIEIGIYVAIISSLVWLLIRLARPSGTFLGRAFLSYRGTDEGAREVYLPLKRADPNANEKFGDVVVHPPSPGVIVYRYEESILYPNASRLNSVIVDYVKAYTRRGKDMSNVKQSDRPWNDPGPRRGHEAEDIALDASKPLLKAIVLDFSAVTHLDTTSVQALIDTRTEVERWADKRVEFHFSHVVSPWTRRALVAGGFGIGRSLGLPSSEVSPVIPSYENLHDDNTQDGKLSDPEQPYDHRASGSSHEHVNESALTLDDMPFFHFDLATAVRSAERGAERGAEAPTASGRSSVVEKK